MRRTDGPFIVYEILPGQLFQRGKLHGLSQEKKQAGLEHYGITRAVALAPSKPDPDLGEWCEYLHLPMPDGVFRNTAFLSGAVTLSLLAIREGGTVLTMCNAGRNRSGLLSALIVRELAGIPGSAAMEVVRHHRPNAIANPHFEKFLQGLP